MKTLKISLALFLLSCLTISLNAQGGNLEFNQAIIMTVNSGQLTVPAGKVWKVTASTSGSAVYFENWTSDANFTWTTTRPNPCTGATSGSQVIRRIYKRQCADSNNKLVVNGTKYTLNSGSPLWAPTGTTIPLSSTPCSNTLSPAIGGNTPYYVNDATGGGAFYVECDGPINQGIVDNGIIISILEFNIVP